MPPQPHSPLFFRCRRLLRPSHLQQLFDLRPQILLVLVAEEFLVVGLELRADHPLPIDKRQHRHDRYIHHRVLHELQRRRAVVVAHWKRRIEVLEERRHRQLRSVLDRARHHLQAPRAVFVLVLAQEPDRPLAMRTVGQDEGQDYRLALVLAERQRRGAVSVDGVFRRLTRQLRRLRQQRNQCQRRQTSLLRHEPQCIAGSSPSTLLTVAPLRRSSKRPSSPRPVTRSSLAESTVMLFHFLLSTSRYAAKYWPIRPAVAASPRPRLSSVTNMMIMTGRRRRSGNSPVGPMPAVPGRGLSARHALTVQPPSSRTASSGIWTSRSAVSIPSPRSSSSR